MDHVKSKKRIKTGLITAAALVLLISLVVAATFGMLAIRTKNLHDDLSATLQDEKYQAEVSVDNIAPITQRISCGYAVIEMFSAWDGGQVTEDSLYDAYGKVVTSTGKSFCAEFNKQNPTFQTTMYKYCTDSELIKKIYDSLSNGIPVPIEWAALYKGTWTLHYSLVTGMDIANDTITVANPYGYTENISIQEFLNRTAFSAFENMPSFYRFAFAFGVFEKNTIFIPVRK